MKSLILVALLLLTGCVEGDRMVRVVETTGAAGTLSAEGVVDACRVETSDAPIEGVLEVTYNGQKCDVKYVK